MSDAELITMAVAQALPGIRSEAHWLRFLPRHLPGAFPYLPGQSGYNKRLRAALPLLQKGSPNAAPDCYGRPTATGPRDPANTCSNPYAS